MRNIFINEIDKFLIELRKLDKKTTVIFISSTIFFIVSWYFSNPNFFSKVFSFQKSFNLVYEDLTAYSLWFLSDSILFFFLPIIIIISLFKESLQGYGLKIGNGNLGIAVLIISNLILVPVIYFVSFSKTFSNYFPLMQSATDNLTVFLIYEAFFIFFIFAWEFIFRGYMLFGLEKKFGIYTIFIQMVPFVLLHIGKPFPETFFAIFGAIFLGYLAFRTRSIIYGFLIHSFILISLDIIAYLRI